MDNEGSNCHVERERERGKKTRTWLPFAKEKGRRYKSKTDVKTELVVVLSGIKFLAKYQLRHREARIGDYSANESKKCEQIGLESYDANSVRDLGE